ncbi:shikimate dehydrogenase [Cyanobium gracile]|uniref:Shikimate dehydrogenase (NADP(+)) n=1 Tax=Cyanobium gracile (strain ATCC 27147 / PCC 6307) TaxID=292564 RepID=K9P8S9_CYAGP|nr:shikimate dehydrogenase [Cyanobium gracile]AFY29520.1 shikimate 5-dehydrogenase [Cyanobium gracile PCC 6307]
MATPQAAPAIGGGTTLAGVLGDPVRHSLSPAMHNAALAALGLDWVYLALPVAAADLAVVLQGLEAIDCRGLNVTLPHKQAAAALAQELTPLARRLGAVNTLVRRDGGGWLGANTDVEGFLAPLRALAAREALVLGCGGSARAVVAGLVELGLDRIRVAGRDGTRLERFLASCADWAPGLEPLAWDSATADRAEPLAGALAGADLVVNTTPLGMASGGDPAAAARSPLTSEQVALLRPDATVYDLIYTPRPTALLRLAGARGCRTIDGLEMLVQQGAASLRLWSGRRDVPVIAMREAALARLGAP